MITLTMPRGDSRTLRVTIVDSEGAAVDLTNYDIVSTARNRAARTTLFTKSSADASEIDKTDPTNGICEIYIVPADTLDASIRSHLLDVEITHTSSGKVYTPITPKDYELDIIEDTTI